MVHPNYAYLQHCKQSSVLFKLFRSLDSLSFAQLLPKKAKFQSPHRVVQAAIGKAGVNMWPATWRSPSSVVLNYNSTHYSGSLHAAKPKKHPCFFFFLFKVFESVQSNKGGSIGWAPPLYLGGQQFNP